jgi:hypothetical protein
MVRGGRRPSVRGALYESTSIAAVYGTISSLVWGPWGSPELWYASTWGPPGKKIKGHWERTARVQIARFRVNSQSSFVRIFFFWIWFDFFDLLTDLARACLSFFKLEPPSSSCEFVRVLVRMVRAITQRPCYLDRETGPDLTSVAVDSGSPSRRVRRARGRLYETQVRSSVNQLIK